MSIYIPHISHGFMAVYNSVRVRSDVSIESVSGCRFSPYICDLIPPTQTNAHKDQTTTPGTTSPTLYEQWVGCLTSQEIYYEQGLWDGTYGLSSLSEKTRKSNHLQMSLQRQHFLLSHLKTLSGGLAGVWTHDLPHGSPVLYQLS